MKKENVLNVNGRLPKSVLLINPPVIDSSGFKLNYSQPGGLLRISTYLKKNGVERVELIDCLDELCSRIFDEKRGCIPRFWFGRSNRYFRNKLANLSYEPELILISSFATYWYKTTVLTAGITKEFFPSAKILVGGVYPTLMREHAERSLAGIAEVFAGRLMEVENSPLDLTLYDNLYYAGIKPINGCPNDCAYCAQDVLNGKGVTYRDLGVILDELGVYADLGIKRIYIFSDNILYDRKYLEGFLLGIINRGYMFWIDAPKGLEPRLTNYDTLTLMKEAGWGSIRLALEAYSEDDRLRIGRKSNTERDFETAVYQAEMAGFKKNEIGAFILIGTPGEDIESVRASIRYVADFGINIIHMAFTPVPGSVIYDRYASYIARFDAEDLNGHLYPFAEYNGYSVREYLQLEEEVAEYNTRVIGESAVTKDVRMNRTVLCPELKK